MVFVPAEGRTYLFGGRYEGIFGTAYRDDLWRFDYAGRGWELVRAKSRPSARGNFSMIYDPDHHQIILFGGIEKQRLGDTWIYNLDENQWHEVTPVVSPAPRSDAGMVYDQDNHVVILFSGYGLEEQQELYDDTWVFDPETNTWIEMYPDYSPPIMYGQTMIYDSINHQVLLWGGHELLYENGHATSHRYGNDIWCYDYQNNVWIMLPYINKPPARYWHQAVFDSAQGRLVIFGGHGNTGFANDTWYASASGTRWQETAVATKPSPRVNPAMSYDSSNNVLILFGGLEKDFHDLQDTWALVTTDSGEQWDNLTP
ncbi:MAG: kelch repeat-containing protein [Chloroflexota bacterium]